MKLVRIFLALFCLVWLTGATWLPLFKTAAAGYTPQGVFYSSATTTSRGQFAGIAASKVGTISFWINMHGGDGSQTEILQGNSAVGNQLVTRNSSNTFGIALGNAAGTSILLATGNTSITSTGGWFHVLSSWNLATSTFQLYINGVNDSPNINTITNDTIDWANVTTAWFIFNDPKGSDIADFWFDPTTFNDLTNATFRSKFISGGNAVFLGSTGQLPTGSSPIMFLTGPFTSWNTNNGTGGNFTTSGTALAASSTNPP